jgi:hypothetical protein
MVTPSRRPSIVRSALIGSLLMLSMLYLDWVVAPIVEQVITGQDLDYDQFLSLTQQAIDVVLTFAVDLALMLVAVHSRRLYGTVIVLSMSLVSWFVYFAEAR